MGADAARSLRMKTDRIARYADLLGSCLRSPTVERIPELALAFK